MPTSYILSSISKHYFDITDTNPAKRKAAKDSWWQVSTQMKDALEMSATRVFDKETTRKYTMSSRSSVQNSYNAVIISVDDQNHMHVV